MNKENFQLWINALRSNKFKQGKGFLQVKDTYCCLGVACEIAIANGVQLTKQLVPDTDHYMFGEEATHLPLKVQLWLGVNYNNVVLDDGVVATHVNDVEHWSFEQIANALQKLVDEEELT